MTIHGGMGREERQHAQEAFTQDKDVEILVATDAAGEGINLQRAHLMVNYDLPWNPNRLEQRFGRIHRIGQTEVCHLWNLVAEETREGEVFRTLFAKLEEEREALGGQVFDVLGKLTFDNRPLRELLVEAIRYGDRPEVRARLHQIVDTALDREHLAALLEGGAGPRHHGHGQGDGDPRGAWSGPRPGACSPTTSPASSWRPSAGWAARCASASRAATRSPTCRRPSAAGTARSASREAVLPRYERIAFEKELLSVPGKPLAAFVCPGHPLLDATIDLILERHRDLLKRGAVLVDPAATQARRSAPSATSSTPSRMPAPPRRASRRVISRQLQFVEIDEAGQVRAAGYAPYLDYRPLADDERSLVTEAAGARLAARATWRARRAATPSPRWCPSTWRRCAGAGRS